MNARFPLVFYDSTTIDHPSKKTKHDTEILAFGLSAGQYIALGGTAYNDATAQRITMFI